MVKIIDEVNGGWKQLLATLFVTAEPKKSVENQILEDESLTQVDKDALIKSLKYGDDLGANIFNNDKIQRNSNKSNKKKALASYSKDSKEKNVNIINKDIGKEIGD